MEQLKQLLARLSLGQRVTIVLAIVAVIGGLYSLSHWNKERDFRPLFSQLAPEDAGQVVAKLRETATEFRLTENGTTIMVPSQKVAELRLQLATAGLPKSGRIGYELFDKTNFGATDFAEQVNYHRALEGELERSVMSLAEVEQARVHITFPKDSIYTESRQPAKASVMVKLRLGAKLSAQNVVAICHLAASAVEGLQPEAVSVLDMSGNLLNRARKPGTDNGDSSEANLEYRQKIEHDLLVKIHGTLEPLLGAERYRASVSVDCDLTSGEQSEEVYDPTKSVMLSSQRTEDGVTSNSNAGLPGTASNLPRPPTSPRSGTGGSNRRTENMSFQSSRLVRHTRLPQGGIKRISVSVLLDHDIRNEKGKRVVSAPAPEKLKVVRDLVAGVIGSVPDRDQIVVESFPFDATAHWEQPPATPVTAPGGGLAPFGPPWLQELMKQKNFIVIAGAAGGILALLLLGIIVLLFNRKAKTIGKIELQMAKTLTEAENAGVSEPDVEKELEANLVRQAALKEQQTKDVLASLKLPPVTTKKTEVLVKHIIAEAKKDPSGMAQVIRSWISTKS